MSGVYERKGGSRFLTFLWVAAWIVQAALWGFLLFVATSFWFYQVPATDDYYAAGLETGFDGLAAIVASAEPDWEEMRAIKGQSPGKDLSRLQGDATFKTWLEQDEEPSWNSGLAKLKFDRNGHLLWVRRYPPQGLAADMAEEKKGVPGRVPVIKSWTYMRNPVLTGGKTGAAPEAAGGAENGRP